MAYAWAHRYRWSVHPDLQLVQPKDAPNRHLYNRCEGHLGLKLIQRLYYDNPYNKITFSISRSGILNFATSFTIGIIQINRFFRVCSLAL